MGFLVQSVRAQEPPAAPEDLPSADLRTPFEMAVELEPPGAINPVFASVAQVISCCLRCLLDEPKRRGWRE
jgi:hypothetical protein